MATEALRDALAAEEELPRGPSCNVGRALVELDPDDAAALQAALDSPTVSASAISRALRKVEVDIGHYNIARHRRGDCRCGR